MKKLMIAAAIVCAAAMSQAATVKWTAANVYQKGSTTLKAGDTYSAYFVSVANMYAGDTLLAKGYSLADAKTKLEAGDVSFLKDYGMTPTTFAVYTTGTTAGQGKGSGGATVTESAPNSQSWSGYLVILDSTSIDGATYAYITDTVTKTTGGTGGAASLSFSANTGTQTADNWYAVSVPEPTSGLLLLLGVGVMALRRRRA